MLQYSKNHHTSGRSPIFLYSKHNTVLRILYQS